MHQGKRATHQHAQVLIQKNWKPVNILVSCTAILSLILIQAAQKVNYEILGQSPLQAAQKVNYEILGQSPLQAAQKANYKILSQSPLLKSAQLAGDVGVGMQLSW